MLQSIRKSTQLLNNTSHKKYQQPEQQRNLCQTCFSAQINKKLFGYCQHLWGCRKCCETWMLEKIKSNQHPKCFVCNAQMRTDGDCLYQYFSNQSKSTYQKFLRQSNPEQNSSIYNSSKSRPCIYLNCSGLLINNRCKKCRRQTCSNCEKQTHSPNQKCEKNLQKICDDAKQCPSCHQYYVRAQGCHHVKCLKCKHEFCQICKKIWSPVHYGCKIYQKEKSKKSLGCFGENACILI